VRVLRTILEVTTLNLGRKIGCLGCGSVLFTWSTAWIEATCFAIRFQKIIISKCSVILNFTLHVTASTEYSSVSQPVKKFLTFMKSEGT
jgi:hypothetical protein